MNPLVPFWLQRFQLSPAFANHSVFQTKLNMLAELGRLLDMSLVSFYRMDSVTWVIECTAQGSDLGSISIFYS